MNIPIYLTLFRILCIPVLVILLLSRFHGQEFIALAVFVIAALSDIADGVLARRTQQTTAMGALLDPIADKLLISSALICLVGLGRVAAWMVVIIIGRELAVSGFRAVASSKGIHIPSPPDFLCMYWVAFIQFPTERSAGDIILEVSSSSSLRMTCS